MYFKIIILSKPYFSIPWLSFNDKNDQSRPIRAFRPGNPAAQLTNQRPVPDKLANRRPEPNKLANRRPFPKSAGKLGRALDNELKNKTARYVDVYDYSFV